MERELRTWEESYRRRNRTQKDGQKWRECENVKTGEIKNYLQNLAGCFGHLGWEDEMEGKCEGIEVLCWP